MGTALTAKQCVQVTLLRPDVGQQIFKLAEGATLADLLRESGAAISSPNVLIDGYSIEDVLPLKSGMVITIVPQTSQTPSNGSWRETIGMFQDTPAFRAMIAEGRAIREADRAAAREAARLEDEQNGS